MYSSGVCSVRAVRRPRRRSKSQQRRKRKDFVSKLAEIIVSDAVVVDRCEVFLRISLMTDLGILLATSGPTDRRILPRKKRCEYLNFF